MFFFGLKVFVDRPPLQQNQNVTAILQLSFIPQTVQKGT